MCSSPSSRRDAGADGPVGAQGVALTPGRSIAVDPAYNALGLPIFVEAGGADRSQTASRSGG